MGRPRIRRSAEEQREHERRQKEKKRQYNQQRRAARLEELRAQGAERMRKARQDPKFRAREAERKRRARKNDEERREADNAAKRQRYHANKLAKSKRVKPKSKRQFLDDEYVAPASRAFFMTDHVETRWTRSRAKSRSDVSSGKLKIDATTQCAVLMTPKATMAVRTKRTSTVGLQTGRIVEQMGLRKADVATQCAVPMTLKATQATVNPRSTRTVGIQTTSATNQQLVDFGAVSWRRDLTTSSWR
ncbi:uncharacterized protein [Dermacentor albipictus]|uniref:uncharacterized protein isoform X5 n=1 Tax=Dermacentor albipictus TaxID=60249 RepID=UPI0031FCAF17